jgi:hypothetical protein
LRQGREDPDQVGLGEQLSLSGASIEGYPVHVEGVLAEPVLKPTALEPKAFGGNVEREGEGRHHTT